MENVNQLIPSFHYVASTELDTYINYAAPTELDAYINGSSYKDVAPTELANLWVKKDQRPNQ